MYLYETSKMSKSIESELVVKQGGGRVSRRGNENAPELACGCDCTT